MSFKAICNTWHSWKSVCLPPYSMLSLLKPQETRTITITVWTRILYSIGFQSFQFHCMRIDSCIFMNQFWLSIRPWTRQKAWALIRNPPCDLRNVAENAAVEGSILKLSSLDVTATEDNVGGRYIIRVHSTTENSRREIAKPPASRAFGEAFRQKDRSMRLSYTDSLTCTLMAKHCHTLKYNQMQCFKYGMIRYD